MLHISIWISGSGTSISIEGGHGWINIMSVSRHGLILSNKGQTTQGRGQGVYGNSWLSGSDGTITTSMVVLSETGSEMINVIVFVRHFASKCEAVDGSNRRSRGSRISKVTINPDFATTSVIFVLLGGFVDRFDDWGHWRVSYTGLIRCSFAGHVFPPRCLGTVNGAKWAQTRVGIRVNDGQSPLTNARNAFDGRFSL